MTFAAIFLLSVLVSVVTFTVTFVSGMAFWSATAACALAFAVSLILLGLAAGGADLVERAERSRW